MRPCQSSTPWDGGPSLVEQPFQDDQRITQRAGDDNVFETAKLIRCVVDQRDAAPSAEVFGIGTSVMPRPVPKYLGLGPAFRVRTGTIRWDHPQHFARFPCCFLAY